MREPISDDDRNVGPREAAQVLGVSETTIKRMLDAGELPFTRVRGRRTIPLPALRSYKRDHTRFLGVA